MPVKMSLHEELTPSCYVCGKKWRREDSKKWSLFMGVLACNYHPGVSEWYRGALKMADSKLNWELGD